MRTNIEIDDELMAKALQAGPFTTKKDAVEAGLRLLARQAAYREVTKWRGKLHWEGDESADWTAPATLVAEPPPPRWDAVPSRRRPASAHPSAQVAAPAAAAQDQRRAGR